jgi:hypothetical protein
MALVELTPDAIPAFLLQVDEALGRVQGLLQMNV